MSTVIRRAIYGRLSGDTTLTGLLASPPVGYSKSIFYQQAPENAAYPFIVLSKQSGVPTDTFTQAGAFETDVWLVKAIDHAESADVAEQIQDRLRTLLNDAPLSISGQGLMALRRQSDVDYSEVADGERYIHAGSLFRVIFQPQ